MDRSFYFDVLYPLQDRVLQVLDRHETGFYLTGGTAASRGYLRHRFSDDLDFFVNDQKDFRLWAERFIAALSEGNEWHIAVSQREERFVRLSLVEQSIRLKIEMVNDVPAHVGDVRHHPVLGCLDSPENILANKITALIDREEPKDLADIWGFCCHMGLSIEAALEGASSKAAGIFPADLARLLCTVTRDDWAVVKWIDKPDPDKFIGDLAQIGEHLLLITNH